MPQKSTVTLPTGDAQIWFKDEAIANLAKAMSVDHNIEIDCIHEGPCLEAAGLYKILDLLCDTFDYNKNRITIKGICNQLEQHDRYVIKIDAPLKHIRKLQDDLKKSPTVYKIFDANIKHFGNFTSRGSRNRLLIGSYLYSNYKDKTLQTYHCNIKDDYHKASIFFDELLWSTPLIGYADNAYKFLTGVTPIKFEEEQVESYPIRDYKMYGINAAYPRIFVDVVCQTYCQGTTFYIDEKVWRPIMMKTPFIVQGPVHFINNFKKLGFKTFNRWWDENYSEAPWNMQVHDIFKIVDGLSKLSINQLTNIYEEMKPTLDYNYEKFMNLSAVDFKVLTR